MTIPTDYAYEQQYNGATNMKHPIITFRPVMTRQLQETNGPSTNSKTGTVLHPDQYQSSPDLGRTAAAQHQNQFHPYIPGFLRGSNFVENDNGTFTVCGKQAVYLKKQYADIANPLLVVTNSPPYTTA
jgi:hypothetical protein